MFEKSLHMVKVNTHISSLLPSGSASERVQWFAAAVFAPHMLYAAIGDLKVDLYTVASYSIQQLAIDVPVV